MSIATVNQMVDWVEDHIERDPTLARLSSSIGYSEYYCSAKFHEHVGVSFKEYLLRRRLSLAATALLDDDSRILDVALRYGFSSHEAFTRAFRREYGCTPRRFRERRPDLPLYPRAHVS